MVNQRVEAVLTVRVVYDLNGTERRELRDLLAKLPFRAAEEGLMTGDTPAEVVEWESAVRFER